ncbi:hypothetical protein [Clostridium lundense]|uniref:hypothetical protein n=1 Tax=Clostridium lundense TaxID=319475 RepID=UPI000484B837|nr:hypothetical protein [Clostridium lundense]
MFNITIKEIDGLLEIYNYGIYVIKGKKDEIIDILKQEFKEETNEYSKNLIQKILNTLDNQAIAA